MAGLLDRLSPGARVAIIRLRSLGDCVLTTPAIQLLHAARPDLDIGVVVEQRFAAVFDGHPDVAATLQPKLSTLRLFAPDVCINLHGGTRSTILAAGSGAQFRVGFAHFRAQSLYEIKVPRAQEVLGEERTVHTAEHLASAMFYMGVPLQEIPAARLYAAAWRRPQPYAVLHPFASQKEKSWPAERFREVARRLREAGVTPVFLAGPADDATVFQDFDQHAAQSLESTKSLLHSAALFIGNDSGPAHMAAAFQVPAVVLFGPSDPVIWAPWKAPAQQLIAPNGDLEAIAVDEVMAAAERLRVAA